jgi:hypothetical protein
MGRSDRREVIASLASPSCPTTVRLTRAYCFFSKGCFFRICSKQRVRTYVESRCRQDVASYVSTMRSFGIKTLFKSLLADATCHNVRFGER